MLERADREPPRFALTDLNRRICFDVLLAIASKVGDSSGSKVHVIADNSRAPTSLEEFWKCAFSGLIDPQLLRYFRGGVLSFDWNLPDLMMFCKF